MWKHKRYIILAVCVFILSVLVLGMTYGRNYYKNYKLKHLPGIVRQTSSKITPVHATPPSYISDYSVIQSQITAKNWKNVLSLANAYGEATTNQLYLRISSYAYCVFAADNLKDTESSNDCKQKGNALIVTLPDKSDQSYFTKVFEATSKNQTYLPENAASTKENHE